MVLDASGLGAPLYLDGAQQYSPTVTANLLPGRHWFSIGSGAAQYFDIAPSDGSLSVENPASGLVKGNRLTVTGRG